MTRSMKSEQKVLRVIATLNSRSKYSKLVNISEWTSSLLEILPDMGNVRQKCHRSGRKSSMAGPNVWLDSQDIYLHFGSFCV